MEGKTMRKLDRLNGTKIVLGVSGSIAAYKSVSLGRELLRRGAEIRVAMTPAGAKFVSPMTFGAALSAQVVVDQFDIPANYSANHISWARWADIILVAPATANIMAKVASGIADDFLTTTILATNAPVAFVPAMNAAMLKNPATQRNMRALEELGYYVMPPDSGELACGETGAGRFPDEAKIIAFAESLLVEKNLLSGKKILITAGPTRESIDPVRFLSNASSGKMGFALADAAHRMGAEVILVHGPVDLPAPYGVSSIAATTAAEMRDAALKSEKNCDAVIMAAAVADFAPTQTARGKIKKGEKIPAIELVKTPDILAELGKKKGKKILVGFALETENLVQNARKKLAEKKLDMIIANRVSPMTGFGTDTNEAVIISKNGKQRKIPLTTKRVLAREILIEMAKIF